MITNPLDVVFGFVIGFGTGGILWWLLEEIYGKRKEGAGR